MSMLFSSFFRGGKKHLVHGLLSLNLYTLAVTLINNKNIAMLGCFHKSIVSDIKLKIKVIIV